MFQIFQSVCQEKSHTLFTNFIHILRFKVVKIDDTRYVDNDQIALVNIGPGASISESKLTTSSQKHLKKVDNCHIISVLHKLLTSQQQTSELMNGFEESIIIRKQELTNNRTPKGTFFVNIKLIDLFGFVDQEKVTYGLG